MADATAFATVEGTLLPTRVKRPHFEQPNPENLALLSLDRDVMTNRQLIEEVLPDAGKNLVGILSLTSQLNIFPTIDVGIPSYMNVVCPMTIDSPTHMFAVRSTTGAFGMFPVHGAVFAAHCAGLPELPPAGTYTIQHGKKLLHLPVVRLQMPHLASFIVLLEYLYTKDEPQVFKRLAMYKDNPHPMPGLAPIEYIMGMYINGLYLRIEDAGFWQVLQESWYCCTRNHDDFECHKPIYPVPQDLFQFAARYGTEEIGIHRDDHVDDRIPY